MLSLSADIFRMQINCLQLVSYSWLKWAVQDNDALHYWLNIKMKRTVALPISRLFYFLSIVYITYKHILGYHISQKQRRSVVIAINVSKSRSVFFFVCDFLFICYHSIFWIWFIDANLHGTIFTAQSCFWTGFNMKVNHCWKS